MALFMGSLDSMHAPTIVLVSPHAKIDFNAHHI